MKKTCPCLLTLLILLSFGALAPNALAQWTTEEVLIEMAPIIEPCVQPTNGIRVFWRCLDVHSSIHAHWAAFRIARELPQFDVIALDAESALTYRKVSYEVAARIDYAYAEAWFLLLAMDFERWATERGRVAPEKFRIHGDIVANRLLERYESKTPNPISMEYVNPSWHLLQLRRWYDFTNDRFRRARVDRIVQEHFLGPISTLSFRDDLINPNPFFSTYGNWMHLVLETQDSDTVSDFIVAQGNLSSRQIVPNPLGEDPHSLGMGWSRAWALRSMARSAPDPLDRLRYSRAAQSHINVGMVRHFAAQGDFFSYDHWVPQFAVYAVTEQD